MRLFFVLGYTAIMLYMLLREYMPIFFTMLIFAFGFIMCIPVMKKHAIKTAKRKIIEAQRARQKGEIIKPFIEVNSVPWYVLAELPGVSIEAAKTAIQLKKQNGNFPHMDVFIQVLGIKPIYTEYIKAVAYVKKEAKPIPFPEPKPVEPKKSEFDDIEE